MLPPSLSPSRSHDPPQAVNGRGPPTSLQDVEKKRPQSVEGVGAGAGAGAGADEDEGEGQEASSDGVLAGLQGDERWQRAMAMYPLPPRGEQREQALLAHQHTLATLSDDTEWWRVFYKV